MKDETLEYSGKLVIVVCWCGVRHAVPEEMRQSQLRQFHDGKTAELYCPLGHAHVPRGKPEAERLREERVALLARLDQEKANRQHVERRLTAAKGQITKARKRAANGVCPGCDRSFVNVAAHVRTKHPELLETLSHG